VSINIATQRLIDEGESSTVELISRPNDYANIAIAACAFLNTEGGTIIAGIDEAALASGDGEVCHPADSEHRDKLQAFLYEEVSPNCVMSVSLDQTDYGPVLVVEVPGGRDTPYTFDGRVYLRKGSSIHVADSQAIREMVLRKATDVQRWERRASPSLTIDDLDARLIKTTMKRAIESRGFLIEHRDDLHAVLQQMQLISYGQLTNAADVLFGLEVASRLPQTRIRAVRYESDRSKEFVDDRLFEGPAINLLDDVFSFIKLHVPISSRFDDDSGRRDDVPQYPLDAINEGLVNALVHRDYSAFSGSVKVSLYPERLEIWNSGSLPDGLTAKKLEQAQHQSILVNPDISHVFYLNGVMEQVGRGTYKIVKDCRSMGLRTPEWKDLDGGVRLTFFASKMDLLKEFSARQFELLKSTEPGAEVLTVEYQKRFASKFSPRQARRDLELLEDYGFLTRSGSGRGTVFTRTKKELPK
jgi:ATP-dependent DNA helicase RecG